MDGPNPFSAAMKDVQVLRVSSSTVDFLQVNPLCYLYTRPEFWFRRHNTMAVSAVRLSQNNHSVFFHGKTLSNVGFFSNSWSNMRNPSHVPRDLVWCRLWDAISIWCLCCYILCCTWILCNSWWTSSFRTWQVRVARGVNDVGSPSHTPCSQLTMWGYHC